MNHERINRSLRIRKNIRSVCIRSNSYYFITYLISKKNRAIKYIPGFILILIGIYNLFYVGVDSSTLGDVNRLLVVVTTMIAGFIGLSTGLIIGIFKKGRE